MIGTLPALIAALEAAPDAPLVVEGPGIALAPGFHLTEVRALRIEAIDCGGARTARTEVEVELMEGGGRPLTVRRLAAILRLGEAPQDAPLFVQVAGSTGALSRHRAALDGAVLRLMPIGPTCPAASRLSCCAA
ncbi:MAG: DUF6428 family protein [Hasllibacter sp.]